MTNAEAIETLKANYPDACYEQLREAVDAAIQALKTQDTIGDIIYRQDAIIAIQQLPSASPERKKGRWIHDGYDFPHGNDWIHCSECGKRGINVPADLTNYCPSCGARMGR